MIGQTLSQVRGEPLDPRTDLFSPGIILYEMATGERPFEGESTASLIGAIMRAEPRPLAERAPASPPALERLIRTCLAKDPEQRWQSAGDVARMLRGLDMTSSGGAAVVAAAAPRRTRRGLALMAVAAVLLVAAGFGLARLWSPAPPAEGAVRAALTLPRGAVYHFSGDFAGPPAISPDGRRVAFVALDDRFGASLWVRDLDRLDARRVPGTEGGSFPFWSPDGRSLGFWSGTELCRVDLETGTVVRLCPANGLRGASWGRDRFIVFAPSATSGLFRVPETGGAAVEFTVRDSANETTHRYPQALPDGKHFLYFSGNHRDASSARSGVWVVSSDGRTRRKLLECRASAVYSAGHLLYLSDSVLFARPFDPRALRFTGDPVPTRERIQPDYSTWTSNLSTSDNGRLAYVLLGTSFGTSIQERARAGPLMRVLNESANHTTLYLERGGRTLMHGSQEVASSDIWSVDVASGRRTRAMASPADEDSPVPSPDGVQFLYSSNRAGRPYRLFLARRDGAGREREFARTTDDLFPCDWSADGRFVIAAQGNYIGGTWDTLWAIRYPEGTREFVVAHPGSFGDARLSPDGRWLAYTEGAIGASQNFVIAFPPAWPSGKAPAGRWQLSGPSSALPRWASGGRELVYARGDGMIVSVEVVPGQESVRFGAERELFRVPLRPQTPALEVSPDGQRFFVNALSGDDVSRLAIVTNWTAGLAKK